MDTLSGWVKGMLKGPGIDMEIFSSHSTGIASTSNAKSVHLPTDLILKAEGWRNMKPYAKYYDKLIKENKFAETILQSGNLKTLKL